MFNFRRILTAAVLMAAVVAANARDYEVISPDGGIKLLLNTDSNMTVSISHDGVEVMAPSEISMIRTDGTVWGENVRVRKAVKSSADKVVKARLYRASEIREHYNSLTLKMKGDWSLELRAYNDGVAYRFINDSRTPFTVKDETADFRFHEDAIAAVPYVARGKDGDFEDQYLNSHENTYTVTNLSRLNPERLSFLPVTVEAEDDVKLCFTEVNLRSYPGMYLYNNDGGNHLVADFATYPEETYQAGHNNLQLWVKKRGEYIAKIDGPRDFPWRAVIVGTDVEIAASDMTYLLAEESKIADTSWIRPGKVAWDWWNAWNISGVDFKAGVNNDTYKYYIDFAAANGIEYVILDEGWAVKGKADLFDVVPEIDLPMLVGYAGSKGVGLILWAGYLAFSRDMEKVCSHYSQMGIKGFKVDFMDRDDQIMTDFNHKAAQMAADYRLILDLHGTHKPAGLNRTWPNVLNFEGVHGLEQMKWAPVSVDQVEYDVMIPFLRQVAGPVDYTQGAMINVRKENYRPCHSEPMSQGTRCHQLALYTIFDSPLNMLCDSPTNYLREPQSTKFISEIPTVWDETKVLAGKMGEYVVMARRSGDKWYVGAITDWTPRDIEIDLSFLGEGEYRMEAFADGVNARRKATDHKISTSYVNGESKIAVHLAQGGGWTAVIKRL